MEAIGKPVKFGDDLFQIQKVIDNYGVEKRQFKYFNKNKKGGINFSKFQAVYFLPKDWEKLKKELRKK